MSAPALRGSCGCGAVAFTVAEPLTVAMYCHCTRCQKRTGAAVQASGRVVPGSVEIETGAEHIGSWRPEVGMGKQFCRECGSHLFAADPETDAVRAIRLAAIDGDPGVRPSAHQYVAYAASWEPLPDDGLPRYDEAAPPS